METEKELSVRIHYDWFYQCRTCQFWNGDSYDYETALEAIDGKWNYLHNPTKY